MPRLHRTTPEVYVRETTSEKCEAAAPAAIGKPKGLLDNWQLRSASRGARSHRRRHQPALARPHRRVPFASINSPARYLGGRSCESCNLRSISPGRALLRLQRPACLATACGCQRRLPSSYPLLSFLDATNSRLILQVAWHARLIERAPGASRRLFATALS